MKDVFNCYKREGIKLLSYLNQKKDEGYIVTKLEFEDGLTTATFEKSNENYVYSVDYSDMYYKNLSDSNEYFDIAKLNGWKLQFLTDGMGIWINNNREDAVPFYLDEEYQKIAHIDYLKRMKTIKITFVFNTILFILGVYHFIRRGGIDIFYGFPFAMLYYYVVYNVLKKKNEYPKVIIEVLSSCFTGSLYLLSKIDFRYAIIIEVVYFIISLYLLGNGPSIMKKRVLQLILFSWIILFIIVVIYGG